MSGFSGTKIPWKLCVTTPSALNCILASSEKFSASTTMTYNNVELENQNITYNEKPLAHNTKTEHNLAAHLPAASFIKV